MNSPVEILLSTFNGENYLAAQLDSIIEQDYGHWKLLVRDDGSSDTTLSVLNKYIEKYPGKIILLADNEGKLGYSGSFSKLLKQSSANYVMYCDQDDYWHPDKISSMLSVMLKREEELPGRAHIVFSDLQLSDAQLNAISQSFLKRLRYSPKIGNQIFFLKNYVPGCNILFNRVLIVEALKTDNIINLHDHWLMMVCGAIGKITFINKPLMKYRLHDNNAIGFIEQNNTFIQSLLLFMKDIFRYGFSNKKYRELLYSRNIRQVGNICERILTNVSNDAMAFSKIDECKYLQRKARNITNPFIRENSVLKQIIYIICF